MAKPNQISGGAPEHLSTDTQGEHPVDSMVRQTIERVNRKGSFILGIHEDKGNINIKVDAPTPLEHDYKADYRTHGFLNTESMIDFLKKYGTKEESVVFVNDTEIQGVLADKIDRGMRETIKRPFRFSNEFMEWQKLLPGGVGRIDHVAFLELLYKYEDYLPDPKILTDLAAIGWKIEVCGEAIAPSPQSKEVTIKVKVNGDERMQKIAKKFTLTIPVLLEDSVRNERMSFDIKLMPIVPEHAGQKPSYQLNCVQIVTNLAERLEREAAMVKDELDGWMVVRGSQGYAKRERVAE